MLRRSVLAACLATALAAPAAAQEGLGDIVETASRADGFSTLLSAVDAAALTDTLKGEGPFTVLAPTNEAFDALEDGTLDALMQPRNKSALQAVLSFHVVPGRVMYDDLEDGMELTTLADQPLRVRREGDGTFVGNARIVGSDIEATNGVIHVPDRVIMPQ